MDDNRPNPDTLLKQLVNEETQKNRGKLKIFFGYAAGVGKTYAMLEAAHLSKTSGIDVVLGYIEPHLRPETLALVEGLEQIPSRQVEYNGVTLTEFDLNKALSRKPQLILVDELAHTNAPGCRHLKRYQDIQELLKAGIDVYTTINVQHIESLNDIVASITSVVVRERIPDNVFDTADQVELVDIEPDDLIERLNKGKIYKEPQVKRALSNFFIRDNLIALREIALRRTADRVNKKAKKENSHTLKNSCFTEEHILICLSPAPSNTKVIRTAARMCDAFHGTFTALFVETPQFNHLSTESKTRFRSHLKLAEQLGAKIITVYGDDISYQISEYAKTSGVSKIVIGHSNNQKSWFGIKSNLVEKLTALAPHVDIYVIPDNSPPFHNKLINKLQKPELSFIDSLKALGVLIMSTLIGLWFYSLGFSEANIITVYILGVLLTCLVTNGKFYSLASSVISVLVFNFFFTEPRFSLEAYDPGYPVTFLVMFIASFITSTLTVRVKEHAKQSARKAYRTEVLLETSQKLQRAKGTNEIFQEMANQLIKLLDRPVIIYPVTEHKLQEPLAFSKDETNFEVTDYSNTDERVVAEWVFKNNKQAGPTTNTLCGAKCLYLAVRNHHTVFAVVGIAMDEKNTLEAFERNLFIAMLSECALALEKEHIHETKNKIALQAKQEQLRANLLRAISHDLRTPLTSISGNAGILISNSKLFDENKKQQLYNDICDDAMWLINLVENLLSVTRIENGSMDIHMQPELLDEVISEALRHISRKKTEHNISVLLEDDLLMAKMDSRLIIQVIINIVDNAIKYTEVGSHIILSVKRQAKTILVEISDNGSGITDEVKEKLFDMFFTSDNNLGDSRRGLGLGLALCKSIIDAHGGAIAVKDNSSRGTTFYFTLQAEEVNYNE